MTMMSLEWGICHDNEKKKPDDRFINIEKYS